MLKNHQYPRDDLRSRLTEITGLEMSIRVLDNHKANFSEARQDKRDSLR